MGIVMSAIRRKANRFNIESRANRILNKEKPTVAPTYEANLRDIERTIQADPNYVEKVKRKDTDLDNRLKSVYVTSTLTTVNRIIREDEKQLPLNRGAIEDFEYGYKEPIKVSPGHCTLRQALKFITDHHENSNLWSVKKISDDYKLKAETVEQILKYFKSFQVFIPDVNKKESVFIKAENQKKIEDSKSNTT